MENNKDLMGWNAPGSNNSSDEEKKREQSSQDPWGRESRSSSTDDLLSGLLKSLKEKGIIYNKGKIEIEYKYVLKDVPYIDFDIENIFCYLGSINVEVSNVQVSTAGLIKKDVQLIDRSVSKDYEEDESGSGRIEF